MKPFYILFLGLGLAALGGGCASEGVKNPSGVGVTEMRPDERGFVAGTGVESQDIVAVTDKMARGLLALEPIAAAKTPPYIVLDPVMNGRVSDQQGSFLTRMQTQLASKSNGKMRFLARDRLAALVKERDAKRAGAFTTDADPTVQEFKGADYFLTGKLQSLTTKNKAGTSDYVLYTFQLINARTSEIVWAGDHEIKKQGLEDAAYR